MANRDLAAPGRHSVQSSIFIPFRGPQAQLQPVAEIVQCGEPLSRSARMAPQASVGKRSSSLRSERAVPSPARGATSNLSLQPAYSQGLASSGRSLAEHVLAESLDLPVDRHEESLTASEDDGIVVGKFSPMAITDSAITLDEELAALDAVDTSHRAVGASVGGVKSAPSVLRVDFSERHSALLDLAQASGDFDVRLERLAVGDYFVGAGVLVERKTYADFAISLVDGRLFLQAAALARSPHRPVILLEGPKPSRMPDVHPHALKGAIVSLAVMWRLPVVHARDPEDALCVLRCLADQIDRTEPGVLKRYDRKPKRLSSKKIYMLQGLPGVGPALADRLLRHFATVEHVMTADEIGLMQVPGLGRTKARQIREILS